MLGRIRRALSWVLPKPPRKVVFPTEDWCEKAAARAPFTPDVDKLEQHRSVLLFDYGTFKRGHSDEFVVKRDGVYAGDAFTVGNYHLFKWDNGRDELSVLALKEQERPQFGRIREPMLSSRPLSVKGEVFVVPWQTLITLDIVRENGYIYRRERVKVVVPYHLEHGSYRTSERQYQHVWCWWYVAMPSWYQAIDGDPECFQPVGEYSPNDPVLRKYRSFTMRDYGDD